MIMYSVGKVRNSLVVGIVVVPQKDGLQAGGTLLGAL